ncbi:unnamed protein product [Strongylus vulgaris]|uniref:Uncharacterized protein n=1 Tax=Strongylus vulgaris TaxID=40348 RepID=A0A3P7L830_STRVU|nr:unnamed protein product [Strongylus vulgaris]
MVIKVGHCPLGHSRTEEKPEEPTADISTSKLGQDPGAEEKHGLVGWTEEDVEDGRWVVYNKGKEVDKEKVKHSREHSYYETLNLIPGKVPH